MPPTVPLLTTKLRLPAPPRKFVPRANIVRRLAEGLTQGHSVTLVSAPAGFGKSTVISEWLADVDLPVAWLSLDADDNDPVRCFTYLIAALRTAADDENLTSLREVEAVLRSGQLPPVEGIANALIADLGSLKPGSLLLVLDDFHQIQEPFILKVFERLIAGLFQASPPVHLVLLTREDPALPLARLRASGLLTEVRGEDLRFEAGEARQFLNDVLELGLSQAEIAALEQKTEGWVVGLQLAGLSLRGHPAPAHFIAGLSGSHRFILGYLMEEVLSRQPEELQNFLLSTSVLDQLTSDLCQAVTGRADSATLLEQVWKANLFLIPLDEAQNWYRYHHLFGDLLRARQRMLYPEQTAALHRRAGQWFARAGEGVLAISEAVRHLLAAEDYAAVVQLIETHAMDMLNQWYAKTVTGWIDAIPPAWIESSPKINLIFARTHLIQGELARALPYITRLQRLFAGDGSQSIFPAVTADWLALQSTMLSGQGQPAQALELALQAQAAAPSSDANTQSQVHLALALAYQQLDEPQHAEEAYRHLIRMGEESGGWVMELLGRSALALMLIQRGRLHEGHALAEAGIARLDKMGILPPISAGLFGELGQVHFYWLNLEQADAYLRRAAQVSALGGFSDSDIFYAVFRSRLCLLRGDVDGAAAEMRQAAALMRDDAPVVVREEVIAQQIITALAQGDCSAAERAFTQAVGPLESLAPGENVTYQQGVLYNCALRIHLHRARQQNHHVNATRQGIVLADHLLRAYRRRQFVPHILEALLLRAQVHAAAGDPRSGAAASAASAASADITDALDLAEPEGYLSCFALEGEPVARMLSEMLPSAAPGSPRAAQMQRVLAVVGNRPDAGLAPQPAQPGLLEPLTGREIEVLRRLAEGQTYEAIAWGLVVSINTVRTHIKAIYGKLGVNNRTAALEMARRMKLV